MLTLLNSYTGNYCDLAASGKYRDYSVASSFSSSVDLTLSLNAALFIYDAVVTFDREVVCFWTTDLKRTGAPYLFYANKWISMSYYVMGFALFAPFRTGQVSCLHLCHGNILPD